MAIGRVTFSKGTGKGVAPKNVQDIRLKAGNAKITLFWSDPTDTIVEEQTLCTWKGTKVVYKAGSYPTGPTDGTVVVDNQVRDAYNETGFEINGLTNGTTYYFALFPYSDTNVYNTNEANRTSGTPQAYKIYGVKRSLTSSNPAWERIEDSVGLIANAQKGSTAVRNDFDSIYPWSNIITCNYNNTTKKVVAYYGDSTFKFDGSNGYVMTIIPEFYYRRYQEDGYEYIYISETELDGYSKSEEFMIGRYTMSGSASGVYSRSGYAPFVSKTISDFRSYAKNLGTGWHQLDWHYFLIQMLYLVEYADYDSQTKLGQGNVTGGSALNSGGCNDLGMKSGCLVDDGAHSVIYRGIEDIFGNIYQFLDGLNIKDYIAYICYDPTKYASDVFTGDYKAIGYTNATTSSSYIKKLGYDSNNPIIALPIEVDGSSSTYIPDRYYCNSGNRIARVGGSCGNGTSDIAGLWCWFCSYASSDASSYYGARLLKTS